jgi:hypothetical protein
MYLRVTLRDRESCYSYVYVPNVTCDYSMFHKNSITNGMDVSLPGCVSGIGSILESDINRRVEWNREDSVIYINICFYYRQIVSRLH